MEIRDSATRARALGDTALVVSPIGLGLAALGRPGYINVGHGEDLGADRSREAMERGAHLVLDAAYDGGVRYFDAARSYGLAEEFLGSWLARRGLAPGAVVVGSKWGYTYTAEWRVEAATHETKDHSLAVFRRQLGESRALLGERLALYQIHSATLDSGVLDDAAVLDALASARSTGLRIGLTVSGVAQAEAIWRALEIRRDGVRVFDTVQATWNVLERAAEPALRAAHDSGVGVIVKEALANGRLTLRNGGGASAPQVTSVVRGAARLGIGADALALAWVLAQPWADVVLSGATTVEQLRSNLEALRARLDDDALGRLRAAAMDSGAYWSERSELRWN